MTAQSQVYSRFPLPWILPVLLLVTLLTIYPVLQTLWTSFHRHMVLLPGSPFVGFDNYRSVVESNYFWAALKNTLRFTALTAPVTVLLGLGVARLLLATFFGRIIVRSVVILPWALPGATAALVWMWIFHPSWGVLNLVLFEMGLIDSYIPWLTDPSLARFSVTVAHIWTQYPFAAILLMAALASINVRLYEAAILDGANGWQRFRYITWPQIKPFVVILLVFNVLIGLTSFDLTFALTAGGPGDATTLLAFNIWRESFRSLNFGNGSAVAFIIVLMSAILLFAILKALPADIFGDKEP